MSAVLVFLVVLMVLVLAHEIGHAAAARFFGCRVDEFGIGLPPRVAARRIGETVYSLNVLPIGGFVRLFGEEEAESDDPQAFVRKPRRVRAIILFSGIAANLVLGFLAFSTVAALGVDVPTEAAGQRATDRRVEIVQVRDTPTLRAAGIRAGDILVAINNVAVRDARETAEIVRNTEGSRLSLTLRRADAVIPVTLQFEPPKRHGDVVGLGLLDVGTIRVPWSEVPKAGLAMTGRVIRVTWAGIGRMVRDLVSAGKVPEDLAGPVGIAALTGAVAQRGISSLLELVGVLSVNLALVNALPIPALDGGRMLFLVLDVLGLRFLRGRPERLAHTIGLVFLFLALVLITISDVRRLFGPSAT